MSTINKKAKRLEKQFNRLNMIESQLQSKRVPLRRTLRNFRAQKRKLERVLDQSTTSKQEAVRTRLTTEVYEFNRRFVKIESEITSLEANLKTTLKPEQERVELDIRNLAKQINQINTNTSRAQSSLDEAKAQLFELEKSKEMISSSLASVTEKRREFETRLDEVDFQIQTLDQEYTPLTDSAHQLDLNLHKRKMEYETLMGELSRLGYNAPVVVSISEIRDAEPSLRLMRFELEQLGSVNQLAPIQYTEQQKNYKQLSIRRNQLEKERKVILDFIDDIERKKKEAFMNAYNQINESFSYFFEKLTGGGRGWLNLANTEAPFAGGLDIFVQFPGKTARLVAGASGGEKSVVAVAFIFAIQSLSPTSFYIFDEVDAHLDPYNAERLADLLKEQSLTSQFIVITLRDVVIDRAEKLYGVYIQNGFSKIVTTKMVEVLA